MLTREQFNEIKIGETFFTVTGPGEFPERGLCSGEWKVKEKCEDRFGLFCRMENVKTKDVDAMHGIDTVGIGWYRANK